MLNKVEVYYFSPTGGTAKVGKLFAEAVAEEAAMIDLGAKVSFPEVPGSDVIVAAAPVFGGRIPGVVSEKLSQLVGTGKKAVTLAVYGNRAYEDALLELNDVLAERGFEIAASGAFIARHSIVPEVAAGRPDEQDIVEIKDFAGEVLRKLENAPDHELQIPGNRPYKPEMNVPAAPISLPACNLCGKCAKVCPTDAICLNDGAVQTDTEKCILCMACTNACPRHARILPPPMQENMNQKLGGLKAVRGKNEWFL